MSQRWPDILGITRNAQTAGSNGERRAKDQLPDKQERHQFAQPLCAIALFQILIRSTGLRHGCTQLRPDKTVTHRESRAEYPAEHGLGAVHGMNNQRNRDKRSNADHVDDVERRGFAKVDFARQPWNRGLWDLNHCEPYSYGPWSLMSRTDQIHKQADGSGNS